ncbi:MAG: DUF2683 family protein [Salinivirgaceae bacterium]|jgi:hypothetical protein
MKAIYITVYTEDALQMEAIKAVIKAFKIKYTISKVQEVESPYNPEFVAKIERGREDYRKGKGLEITMDELKALCK